MQSTVHATNISSGPSGKKESFAKSHMAILHDM